MHQTASGRFLFMFLLLGSVLIVGVMLSLAGLSMSQSGWADSRSE